MLRVGLIGYGYWGPNLARNINANEGCELVRVADTLENRRGVYVTNYSLFVALSGNGKTSTTCRVLARKGRER